MSRKHNIRRLRPWHSVALAGLVSLRFALPASGQHTADPVVARPATGTAAASVSPTQPTTATNRSLQTNPLATAPTIDSEPAAGAQSKGDIHIHGHWVIEVTGKDGIRKDRREFENSYSGGNLLGQILAGQAVIGDPSIQLSLQAGATPLCPGSSQTCSIFTSATSTNYLIAKSKGLCDVPAGCYPGAMTSTVAGTTRWVLTATVVPVLSGTFDFVSTSLTGCYGYETEQFISPATCSLNALGYSTRADPIAANFYFTGTQLTAPTGPVAVTAGDALVITVTISFS